MIGTYTMTSRKLIKDVQADIKDIDLALDKAIKALEKKIKEEEVSKKH